MAPDSVDEGHGDGAPGGRTVMHEGSREPSGWTLAAMWGSAKVGDWVRASRTIPITTTDHLTGGGIRPGTLGVVLQRTGSHLQVRFDNGWGSCSARVRASHCRVQSRGRGQAAFARRTHTLTVVRLTLAAFLLWPFIWFVVLYVWTNRSFEGLLSALAVGTIDGAANWLALAIIHPVQSLVYAVFVTILTKIAFPHR